MPRRFTVVLAAVLSAVLAVLSVTPAQAATSASSYAALGDSYAVGYGAGVAIPPCWQAAVSR